MMNYSQTLQYLYSSTPVFERVGATAYKPGLKNIIHLLNHLGLMSGEKWLNKFPVIHVAGTNGKGSTSHLLAAVLQSAGYKTALFTSPHLVEYTERMRINGRMISKEKVVEFVERHKKLIEQVRPSFFEITTAMAFEWFAAQQVDIAVVEVGLGGRLDSTNVVVPLLSVITNIGFDHEEFLGSTLAQIASEKAGIIKPCVPVVVGEWDEQTASVFVEVARQNKSPILFANNEIQDSQTPPCALKGAYQEKNKKTVLCALQVLKSSGWGIADKTKCIADKAISSGFLDVCALTGLRGRWERISVNGKNIILDTGHNSHGVNSYAPQLSKINNLHIVFGMVDDKDVCLVLQLLPQNAVYYWCSANTKRAINAATMQSLGARVGLQGNVYQSVEDALLAALENTKKDDTLFVGGSNYVVGQAIQMLDKLNLKGTSKNSAFF